MSKLTQRQAAAVDLLRARLNPQDAGFRGTAAVANALDSIRSYLDSYVLPLVEHIEHGDAWHDEHVAILRDAASVRAQRERGGFKATFGYDREKI